MHVRDSTIYDHITNVRGITFGKISNVLTLTESFEYVNLNTIKCLVSYDFLDLHPAPHKWFQDTTLHGTRNNCREKSDPAKITAQWYMGWEISGVERCIICTRSSRHHKEQTLWNRLILCLVFDQNGPYTPLWRTRIQHFLSPFLSPSAPFEAPPLDSDWFMAVCIISCRPWPVKAEHST